jgi:hypothetical protein
VGVQRYVVRCYRKTPGDADCPDVPAFGEDNVEDIVELAGQMLLAYFNDPRRPPERKPRTADLEDEYGQIVVRLRVIGPEKVERVAN